MDFDTKNIISGSVLLIALYLIIANGSQTNSVITSLSNAYDGAVGTLQGRGGTTGATGTGLTA